MSDPELHRPPYVPDLLVNALNQTPERPLLQLDGGPTLSVGEVRDATSRFVQALASRGISAGSRVATLSSNRPEVLYIAQALQVSAAVSVPMHPLAGLSDHLHAVRDAGADVLVFEAGRFGERAGQLSAQVPGLQLLALGPSGIADDLCELAARLEPRPLVAPTVEGSDVARLGYSGGTTGKPKALATTQRSAMACASIMLAEWEWPSPPRVLSCAPLSHAGSAMVLPTLLKQGTILVHPTFHPERVMQAIQDYRINCMLVVPTMIYAILDHPRFDEFDLSSLETVFYGASAISPARLKEAIERIGPVFSQFYGQAEAPMTLTLLRKAEHDVGDLRRLSSCGRPVPWIRLELMDSDGKPVADGEPGEICVQGPLVMDGYRDNPELTREALAGGWLHTGDVAVRDPDGFLRIVDRTKDMIVSGGFNIYPRQIEDVIAEDPAVAQVAVIGIPHPKWGEAVTALVVPRPGATVDADALIARVADRKGKYQAPKAVEIIDTIPQTAVGKPDKKALRARYGMGKGPDVGGELGRGA
ncbi:MAG: AMP-binding protein [Myxococcales bacterium]|nr:AMP-binding protein [Myxococcales bacterium]